MKSQLQSTATKTRRRPSTTQEEQSRFMETHEHSEAQFRCQTGQKAWKDRRVL